MVLAIGLVVDDAIVVVENVERQLEAGLQPLAAARAAMKRGHRADHRHHRRADGGVRAGRLHSRRRRPSLQPVRADGRDLGRHLRLQFADAQSGAERRLPAPPRRRAVSCRSAGSTPASTWLSHAYAHSVRVLIRLRWIDARAVRGGARRDLSGLAAHPVDLPAGRGPGLFLRRHPAARTARRCSAPTRWPRRCATSCKARPASISSARSAASTS